MSRTLGTRCARKRRRSLRVYPVHDDAKYCSDMPDGVIVKSHRNKGVESLTAYAVSLLKPRTRGAGPPRAGRYPESSGRQQKKRGWQGSPLQETEAPQ